MSNQRSYIALNWVTEEIIETLEQAKQALRSFIDNPHDITKLRFCLTYIHQVTGGLVMVELHAGSVLSKAIEVLVADIIKATGDNAQQGGLLTAVERAIEALADYVRRVNKTHQDDADSLLDTINNLRQLSQLEKVGAAEMFDPNIEAARLTQKQKPRMTEADFDALILKLDRAYQHALNHLTNDLDAVKNLALLNKITASLYKVSRSTVSEPLWQIVFTIAEYLQAYPQELNDETLKALRLVYQEIMSLRHSGVEGLATTPSSQLIKTLLYSVATTESVTENIAKLREQYQLDVALSKATPMLSLEDKVLNAFIAEYTELERRSEPYYLSARQQSSAFLRSVFPDKQIGTLTVDAFGSEESKRFAEVYFAFTQQLKQQLDATKEHITAYIDSNFDNSHIQHLPEQLLQQAKALFVSTTYDLSRVLLAARGYLQSLSNNEQQANSDELEWLADAISAVEYYLECSVAESPDKLKGILDHAEQCIAKLNVAEHLVDMHLLAISQEQPSFAEDVAVAVTENAVDGDSTGDDAKVDQGESFVLSGDVDEEILEIFIEEANEVLELISESLPTLEADYSNTEILLDIRRGFHTLKGSGRMVGAEHIGDFAWAIENVLNKVRDGVFALNSDVLTLVRNALDKLPAILSNLEQRIPYPLDNIQETVRQADLVLEGKPLVAELPEIASEVVDVGSDSSLLAGSDAELLNIFIAEAETHIQVFSEFLDAINPGFEDAYVSSELQRALHTLKGSAYMADIHNMAVLATPLEGFIKDMANFQSAVDTDMLALLIRACQALEQQLAFLRDGYDKPIDKQEEFIEEIRLMHISRMEGHEAEAEETNILADKYTALLSKALDSMTDSSDLLMLWRSESIDESQQKSLLEAMHTLAETAALANYYAIENVAAAFTKILQHAISHPQLVDQEFFELANKAQEELEDMMDVIAAQQTAEYDPALLEQLEQFLIKSPDLVAAPDEGAVEKLFDLDVLLEEPEPAPVVTNDVSSVSGNIGLLVQELSRADEELLEIFVEELADLAEELESVAQPCLQQQEIEQADIDELKRILHTIKGGARMTELSSLGDITHDYETMLESAERQNHFDQLFFQEFANYHHQFMLMSDGVFNPDSINVESSLAAESQQTVASDNSAIEATPHFTESAELSERVNVEAPALDGDNNAAQVGAQQLHEQLAQADEELLEIFAEELGSLVEELEVVAQPCIQHSQIEQANIDELKRILHTIKGGARMAELSALGDITHDYETMLESAERQRVFDGLFFENFSSYHRQLLLMTDAVFNPAAFETSDFAKDALVSDVVSAEKAELDELSDLIAESVEQAEPDAGTVEEQTVEQDELSVEVPVSDPAELDAFSDSLSQADGKLVDASDVEEAQEKQALESEAEATVEPTEIIEAPANVIPIRKGIDIGDVPQAAIEATRKFIDSFNQEQQRATRRESVRVDPEVLETLINLAGENIIGRARMEEQMSELRFSLEEMDSTIDRLHAQLRRLEIETEAQITFRQEQVNIEGLESFDPLEMDRYSHMQQLSKSLIEAASDIDDLSATFTGKMRDMDTLLIQQSRVNTELQESLMRFQMVPFSRMVPRLRRIIRQISQEVGKQVELNIENAEGELDRTILEKMIAPLEHMLRNAVDHGIESPQARKQSGKSENGTITIHLSREGGEVVLAISDDGAGINLAAVRDKAIERGLLSADAQISDNEILQFILAAGFSTAESVTQISGRGVGMDVVNSEIKQIGGSISIDSQAGKGTTFIVRLPFTVSINRALMVGIGNDTFAIPLTSIEGIVRVSPFELEAYYQPGAPLFDYAGRSYNLRYLGSLLHRGQAKIGDVITPLPVVLIRSSDYTVAVQVDRLLGSHEIVVKSLGPQFSMVQGLSGATVLGDGGVVVILDMMALIRSDISRGLLSEADAIASKDVYQEAVESKATRAMVVDDSVTVRKVTSRLLERYGLEVDVARDGLDAITQLLEAETLPDIMLLDIEMPRMDGFEVLSRLRHNERLQHIPVVMITSRTGEKHRERALSLGANRYLGKPFQESELLQVIGELTKTEILQVQ